MILYVICYDRSSNKRRKKISDLLEGYGRRVQYSVFECVLSPQKYAELKIKLKKAI
nr:CRISPR-associated endonuclease Cas2 [uncultured Thermosynechococcus sp.]